MANPNGLYNRKNQVRWLGGDIKVNNELIKMIKTLNGDDSFESNKRAVIEALEKENEEVREEIKSTIRMGVQGGRIHEA